MSAAFDTSETPATLPVWRNAIGWILVGIAFLIATGLAVKADNAFEAGRQTGRMIAAGLFLFLIAWAVTRKSSPGAQANARIVVGVLLVLSALAGVGNGNGVNDKEVAKKFLQDAIGLNKQHEKRFHLLSERLDKSDLSNVLAPASVTTKAGRAKSREELTKYRSLIAERSAVLKMNLDEGKNLVLQLPAGSVRSSAEAVVEKKGKEMSRLFSNLERAELAQLAVIEKILEWCAGQGNKVKHEDGKFLFTSKAQQTQFQAFHDELEKVGLEVGYASKAVEHMATRVEAANVENIKKAKKLLAD